MSPAVSPQMSPRWLKLDILFYILPYLFILGGDNNASHVPAFISHVYLYRKLL